MKVVQVCTVAVLFALAVVGSEPRDAPAQTWQTLEPGLEFGVFSSPTPSIVGDSKIRILRIDPQRFELRLLNASAPEHGSMRTTKDWCQATGLLAAINASMYQTDHRSSVSLMLTRTHVNKPHLTKDKSVLAFDALTAAVPPVTLFDRACDDFDAMAKHYGTLVQSIRMISCHRGNVWARQPRVWSTAAIGVDRAGRVLFIHARSPYSTHDLIDILLGLPIDLARAMYVEGGPEAQLYVNAGGQEHELFGSYETGFNENDSNDRAWPVPNVVGVRRRAGG